MSKSHERQIAEAWMLRLRTLFVQRAEMHPVAKRELADMLYEQYVVTVFDLKAGFDINPGLDEVEACRLLADESYRELKLEPPTVEELYKRGHAREEPTREDVQKAHR